MIRLLFALAFFLPFSAHAFELEVPIGCTVGKDCFIQNYVDTSAGEDYADYRCRSLSYDKHDGTDFRLRNYVEMLKGVPVMAAAAGTVIGVRDEMEDINFRKANPAAIKNRECGNGVVIDHGDGWQTQYCHMRRHSIQVKKGFKVSAGTLLGFVGLSGKTEFPHLHLSVRKDGTRLDPFTGKEMEAPCTISEPTGGVWSKKAKSNLPYVATALLGLGFAKKQPDADDIRQGKDIIKTASPEAEAIVLWVDMMGLQKEDVLLLEIFDPKGRLMHSYQKNFERDKAQYFQYTGKKEPNASRWEEGIYKGKITLFRKRGDKAEPVLTDETELYIR